MIDNITTLFHDISHDWCILMLSSCCVGFLSCISLLTDNPTHMYREKAGSCMNVLVIQCHAGLQVLHNENDYHSHQKTRCVEKAECKWKFPFDLSLFMAHFSERVLCVWFWQKVKNSDIIVNFRVYLSHVIFF